jgi:uncharacterized protein
LTILGLYDDLKFSFSQLNNAPNVKVDRLNFQGFNQNEESELLSIADAQRGTFPSVIYKTGNSSEVPMREKYQAMIQKWNDLGQPRVPISQEAILEILNAENELHV